MLRTGILNFSVLSIVVGIVVPLVQAGKPERWPCDVVTLSHGLSLESLERLGKFHLELINADREYFPIESDGALSLLWDNSLWKAALCHAKTMCENDFFSHVDLFGKYPWDRMDAVVAIPLESYAENIAYRWQSAWSEETLEANAKQSVFVHHLSYMNECQCGAGCPSGKQAGHRSNILNPDSTHVGIAEWPCEKNGRFYNVMDFGRYRGEPRRENLYCTGNKTLDPPHPFSKIGVLSPLVFSF